MWMTAMSNDHGTSASMEACLSWHCMWNSEEKRLKKEGNNGYSDKGHPLQSKDSILK